MKRWPGSSDTVVVVTVYYNAQTPVAKHMTANETVIPEACSLCTTTLCD